MQASFINREKELRPLNELWLRGAPKVDGVNLITLDDLPIIVATEPS